MAGVYAKVSCDQFFLLNPCFSKGQMFKFKRITAPKEYYDLDAISNSNSSGDLIKNFVDDKAFGELYAIVGDVIFKGNDDKIFFIVVLNSSF